MITLPKWTIKALIAIVLLAVVGFWQFEHTCTLGLSGWNGLESAGLREREFSEAMEAILSRHDSLQEFNGIIAWLPEDGTPLYSIHGFQDPLTQQHPLTKQDRFHLASVSKLFTGLAALHLVRSYGLSATDSIAPYFESLHPALGKVTIQQLANHTNGIHDYLSLTNNHHGISNKDVLKLLAPLDSTVFAPGSDWGYSNSGYVLLAQLIEAKSGMPFQDYLKKYVLQDPALAGVLLRPQEESVLQGCFGDSLNTSFSQTMGDAGMYVMAEELMAFCQDIDRHTPLLKEAKNLASPWRDPAWKYGFGWFFSEDQLGAFRAHSGQTEGFQAYLRINETGGAFFILTNQHGPWIEPLREGLLRYWMKKRSKTTVV